MIRRALTPGICLLALAWMPLIAAEDDSRGVTISGWSDSAESESGKTERHALVIGNGAYEHMDPLRNPPSDVKLISEALEDVGFEVRLLVDTTKRQMDEAAEQFAIALDDAGRNAVGVFYYAGHAVSYKGRNWLLPVNADITQAPDIEYEAISSAWILGLMEGARNATDIMVLDSCRDSPIRGFSLSGTRSLSRGLVTMDAPTGSFIAYSTAPGQVAYDGTGDYSPFAAAFAAEILTPNLSIGDMMIEVTRRVKETTKSLGMVEQVPWTHSSLDARFAFNPTRSGTRSSDTETRAGSTIEMKLWESIEDSTDPSEYKAYLSQYPDGDFAAVARARVRRFSQGSTEGGHSTKTTDAPVAIGTSDFTVSPMKFRGVVNSATGAFAKPDRLSHRQRRLQVGDTVRVTGRVENRLWYRLELDGGTIGYVSMSAVDRL